LKCDLHHHRLCVSWLCGMEHVRVTIVKCFTNCGGETAHQEGEVIRTWPPSRSHLPQTPKPKNRPWRSWPTGSTHSPPKATPTWEPSKEKTSSSPSKPWPPPPPPGNGWPHCASTPTNPSVTWCSRTTTPFASWAPTHSTQTSSSPTKKP